MIGLPFIGALLMIAIPAERIAAAHWLTRLVATIGLMLAIYIFLSYDHNTAGEQLRQSYSWLPSLGINLDLAVNGITAPLVLLNGVVFFSGTLISRNVTVRSKEFFFWLMLLVAGVYGTFLSLDLFFFFFFYELAVLPMYLLIGVSGYGEAAAILEHSFVPKKAEL